MFPFTLSLKGIEKVSKEDHCECPSNGTNLYLKNKPKNNESTKDKIDKPALNEVKPEQPKVSGNLNGSKEKNLQTPKKLTNSSKEIPKPKTHNNNFSNKLEEDTSELIDMKELQTDFIIIFLTINEKKFSKQIGYYLQNLVDMGFALEITSSEIMKGREFVQVKMPVETVIYLAGIYKIGLACKNPYYETGSETPPCFQFLDSELTTRNPSAIVSIRNPDSIKRHKPTKPTNAERIMVAHAALNRAKYGCQPYEVGVEELKNEGVIESAYPLHDGPWEWTTTGPLNDRQLLSGYWANLYAFFYIQPLHLIQKYFGPEAGFYFAQSALFMGMLAVPAILGLLTFLMHIFNTDTRANDICNSNLFMCPSCKHPRVCKFSWLNNSCRYSYLNYMFDNDTGFTFAILMSLWGVIFVVLWERKESLLKVKWMVPRYLVSNFTPRKDYCISKELQSHAKKFNQKNEKQQTKSESQFVTKETVDKQTPHPTFPKSQPTTEKSRPVNNRINTSKLTKPQSISGETNLDKTDYEQIIKKLKESKKSPLKPKPDFHIQERKEENIPYQLLKERLRPLMYLLAGVSVAIIIQFSVMMVFILLRIKVLQVRASTYQPSPPWTSFKGKAAPYMAAVTAVFASVIIIILDQCSNYAAFFLTNLETSRTRRDFDRSYMVKLVTFSLINIFPAPIYLAFFRGYYYTYPGDEKAWSFLFGVNGDYCDISGCVADLWIFLATFSVLKPVFNIGKNIAYPVCCRKYMKKYRMTAAGSKNQWELDHDLIALPSDYFTKLHKELLLKYSYVVCFGSSFHLLPLIVLLMNVIEQRVNAAMLVRYTQRIVPIQSRERDMWNKALYVVTIFAIFINAFAIGVTLNWADRHYYKSYVDSQLKDYIKTSISEFPTSEYNDSAIESFQNCYYPGRRLPKSDGARSFQYSDLHFEEYCSRYIFIVILLLSNILIGFILRTVISTPHHLQQQIVYQEKTFPKLYE